MDIKMPKLGLTMTEGTLSAWLVQEGDAVKQGEILFEFESDKSTMEYEAPANGVVAQILVPAGTTVPCGTVVTVMNVGTAAVPTASAEEPGSAPVEIDLPEVALAEEAAETAAVPGGMVEEAVGTAAVPVTATPAAKRRARELGVNLAQVPGRGPNGRIHVADVEAVETGNVSVVQPLETVVAAGMAATPVKISPVAERLAADLGVDVEALAEKVDGRITRADVLAAVRGGQLPAEAPQMTPAPAELFASRTTLGGVRGVIAERMQASAAQAPHVTLHTEVDATQLIQARLQMNASLNGAAKISYNAILVSICARALRQFPAVNACLLDDELCVYADVHVGLAVDTERGLLVPVIRDADQRSVREIQAAGDALIARALDGKSLPDDLQGGTFTVTNLGMFGIDAFTPIINQPQAAILGVGRIVNKPVGENGELVLRDRLTLSLSFDHRIVDGAPAASFLQAVGEMVERPYSLLL